jgi:hypothetical protein
MAAHIYRSANQGFAMPVHCQWKCWSTVILSSITNIMMTRTHCPESRPRVGISLSILTQYSTVTMFGISDLEMTI